jgi:serine/threonine protein kinase
MPVPTTCDAFIELVIASKLADRAALTSALKGQPDFPAPQKLAVFLVKKGLLTKWQAEQILQGYTQLSLGKYQILGLLGRGGMGAVYLGEHTAMRRRVAIKVLPGSKSKDTALVQRFFREARAVAALNHPNIVQAHDIDSQGKTHYLVMEHVEGMTLQDLLGKSGPLAIERAAHYTRQAAEGLQHAFEAGLVHRDIKPANLLLNKNGVIKILDMGLALFFQDEKDGLTQQLEPSAVLGTLDYLAPEQSVDSHAVDIRADIYSLGATFYCLLAGRAPFSGTLAQKLVSLNMQEPPPIRQVRPDVPEELAAVLARMMAKQPADRYEKPADVARALAPWASRYQAGAEDTVQAEESGGRSTSVVLNSSATTEMSLRRPTGINAPQAAGESKGDGPTQVLTEQRSPRNSPRSWRWVIVGGAAAVLLFLVGVGALIALGSRSGTAKVATNDAVVPPKTPNTTVNPPPKETWDPRLQAHFPLDGDVADVSMQRHRLFLNNSAFLAPGRGGKILQVNGKNQYAATEGPIIDTSRPFAVAAWVNAQGKRWSCVLGQDGERISSFLLQERGDNRHLCLCIYDSEDAKSEVARVDSREPALEQVWYHVVGVFTGTQAKIYLNGRLRETKDVKACFKAGGPFVLGASKAGGGRFSYFEGQISDVRIFGAALDDAEVLQLYGRCAGLSGAALEPLPAGWTAQDLQKLPARGQTYFDAVNDQFSIFGGGEQFGGATDQCHFAHAHWQGDGEMVARVRSAPVKAEGADLVAAGTAGLMCRDQLTPTAPMAAVLVSANSVSFQYRRADKAEAEQKTVSGVKPVWLKLVRQGSRVSGYYSVSPQLPATAGEWKQVGATQEIALSAPKVPAGLAITALGKGRAWAAFSQVTFTPSGAGVRASK